MKVLAAVLLMTFLGVGACVAFVGGVADNMNRESQRQVSITYQVEGSGQSVAVTYSGNDFNSAQDTDVALPWTKQVTITGLLKTVSLTATNGYSGGSVTCRIFADGNLIAQQTSTGPFATANCIGDAGQRSNAQTNTSVVRSTTTSARMPPSTLVTSSSTATTPSLLPNASTSDVSAAPTGDTAHLVAVRLHRENGYDRLVLEFTDQVPGYTVGYRPLPAHMDASGEEIPLPGANAMVQVTLNGATADGWSGDAPTYLGPSTVTNTDTEVVTEAKAAGDFEAVLTWVVGMRAKVPFRVLVLDGPPRLVVDLQE